MNPNVHVERTSFSGFTLCHFNVNQGVLAEKVDHLKWSERQARVRATILATKADVITLNEMRPLNDLPGMSDAPTVEEWLATFSRYGYGFFLGNRNATITPLNVAILWSL